MLWYRQAPGQSLQLMATSNVGSKATYEKDFTEKKILVEHPNLTFSSLTMNSVQREDSYVYFCAASDTELG